MIYCKVSELIKYKNYSKNMECAINYVLSHELTELPLGKTVIDGDKVYINKSNPETKIAEEQQYEVHHRYIDIQIDLDGDEKLYILNCSKKCTHPFDEAGDYALYANETPDTICNMNKDYCVVCLPNEIHMPCVRNTTEKVLKCVVKVLDE